MIHDLLDANESPLWQGKPDKLTYVIGQPILYIFALIWGVFDFGFISLFLVAGPNSGMDSMGFFIIPFFAIHLMPVWIAIGGPIYRIFNWNYINYVITEKRIYIESGIIGRDVNVMEFIDIYQPSVNVGVIERLRNCGTIRLVPTAYSSRGNGRVSLSPALVNIYEPYVVYKMIKEMSLDIKSDINYPNAMRPDENPGYQTKYLPK